MADDLSQGILVERLVIIKSEFKAEQYDSAKGSHRDEGHTQEPPRL
jgi:hypothetical protein